MALIDHIRDIPDFPKKGIVFKDIMLLLQNADALAEVIDTFCEKLAGKKIDKIVAPESRGFIFGPALAYKLNAGFVAVRKPGKLPYRTKSKTYDLEYGTDTIEIHEDALNAGENVLIVDDLLATGGTVAACQDLIRSFGANVVACCFLIELDFLNGREKLDPCEIISLIRYDGE